MWKVQTESTEVGTNELWLISKSENGLTEKRLNLFDAALELMELGLIQSGLTCIVL